MVLQEKDKEVRSAPLESLEGEDSRTIRGCAIRFGVPSVALSFGELTFREVVLPTAISEETIRSNDIKAYMCHDSSKLLARSNHGEGTLHIELRDDGLHFSFDAPKTSAGDEALELIRRGDIRQCSFAFWNAESNWVKNEDGTYIREITKLPYIDDISVVINPAYDCTEVSVRGLTEMLENKAGIAVNEPPVGDDYFNELEALL